MRTRVHKVLVESTPTKQLRAELEAATSAHASLWLDQLAQRNRAAQLIESAETAESVKDFDACLQAVEEALVKATARIATLRARAKGVA